MSSETKACAAHADLPQELWLDIFRYATYHPKTSIAQPDPFLPGSFPLDTLGVNMFSLSMQTKRRLVLVCRTWRRMAVEVLYEYVGLRSPRIAQLFFRSLEQARECENGPSWLGQLVQHIQVWNYARRSDGRFLQKVFDIFLLCPNVKFLSGNWTRPIPSSTLLSWALVYGPSLKGLCWQDEDYDLDHTFITSIALFQSLRILDLRYLHRSRWHIYPRWGLNATLPLLTRLQVSNLTCSLGLAARLTLPSLQRVVLDVSDRSIDPPYELEVFLLTHGKNIMHLEIRLCACCLHGRRTEYLDSFLSASTCPNLQDVLFSENESVLTTPFDPHPSLRRIGIQDVTTAGLYPKSATKLRDHFLTFTRANFPKLEVVRTIGYNLESSQDMYANDVFMWWVEHFERDGIDFLDGAGILWLYDDGVEDSIKDKDTQQRALLTEPQVRDVIEDDTYIQKVEPTPSD